MLGWFAIIFIVAAITVANLAIKYYEQSSTQPFISLTLSEKSLTMFSSAFMIDAISIYMAIIFTIIGAIVFLYSIFYISLNEAFSGRYFSLMLIIIGCIIGVTFSGDFMTLFIFWEASAAGSCFLMLYQKTPKILYSTLKILDHDNHSFSIHNLWPLNSVWCYWNTQLLGSKEALTFCKINIS